mmetsp:Transcript_8010/g.10741  ORF Transcript_8010/g.10741 Transcript_8010/m.10741 type:complete len:233 (+) Transcript_8010:2594-3292(+)
MDFFEKQVALWMRLGKVRTPGFHKRSTEKALFWLFLGARTTAFPGWGCWRRHRRRTALFVGSQPLPDCWRCLLWKKSGVHRECRNLVAARDCCSGRHCARIASALWALEGVLWVRKGREAGLVEGRGTFYSQHVTMMWDVGGSKGQNGDCDRSRILLLSILLAEKTKKGSAAGNADDKKMGDDDDDDDEQACGVLLPSMVAQIALLVLEEEAAAAAGNVDIPPLIPDFLDPC